MLAAPFLFFSCFLVCFSSGALLRAEPRLHNGEVLKAWVTHKSSVPCAYGQSAFSRLHVPLSHALHIAVFVKSGKSGLSSDSSCA
eukprot:CAMPEP_0179231962 /NCGR_PEP_ID=MMETSP0797-20121207/11614_1 /TAXON_ID=47934 /ORGANISM="Dinophysis acuminata, Strain DAEP01" /LENGTH=84 /DNA_ID=CAMNT_0020939067 /DNA_START=109 /DNA_END=363 /DNA_ORIENTATION=+